MRIEIARLTKAVTHFRGLEKPSILDLDNDPTLRPMGPVHYDLAAQIVSHRLLVQGVLRVRMECECARCAVFFSTEIKDSAFLRDYELGESVQTVDLTDDLREALLLQLPHVLLCRPECRGLCPVCGRNRNEGPCDCRLEMQNNPWKRLEELDL